MAGVVEQVDDLAGRMLGDFVLRERIDEGGFGAVYRCVQPLLGREAVIKVLHRQLRHRDVALQRFMREAQLASRLDHPYAAHIYAFGLAREDGLLWIAMELVQGTTLDRWLAARGPLPIDQLVPFFDRVAEVVHVAHEAGIIHRDLKPSNIMVVERAGQLLPKLLDFGVAKLLDGAREFAAQATAPEPRVHATDEPADRSDLEISSTRSCGTSSPPNVGTRRPLTHAGATIGSPPYMAPEQWTGPTAVGPAADIYALGIIAYEALAGRRPFVATTVEAYAELHERAAVPPLGGDFARALDKVFARALAKRSDERYASALELAAALRAALKAHPREQLRDSARQWEDRARPHELLWRGGMLADVNRWAARAPAGVLNELERSFVFASRRRARFAAWIRRTAVTAAVATAIAALQYRAVLQTRAAAALVTQGEVEQGRSALLHDEAAEAQAHLVEAYNRGDRSAALAFMIARALQPRLAEQARFPSSAGRMWSAMFSPDGARVVTSDDRGAQVRDARTGAPRFNLPHGDTVYHAMYTADGARIVTAGGDDAVGIWDAATGALVRKLRGSTPARYFIAAVSPDGARIAAIDTAGAVARVWDAGTGVQVAELGNDASEFPSIAFSADGRWLATGGGDDVRVFDTGSWTQVLTIAGPRIHSLSFDPRATRIATAAADGDVTLTAIPSGTPVRTLRGAGEPVDALTFSPDGTMVAAGARNGAVRIWDAASGQLRSQANVLHARMLSLEFDRASELVVAAGASGSVAVTDAGSGMAVATLDGPQAVVRAAHFDPSARRVVAASFDGTARIWDATSPYRRWGSAAVATDCGLGTSLEPDRRFVAIGCRDQATRIWDTARDQLLAELPSVTQVDGDLRSAYPAVSAAGDRAAIARGNTVELYELPGGRLLRTVAHGAAVTSVAFAARGGDLVSGDASGSLLVTRDGRELALPVAEAAIDAAGFLPDGRVVATDAHQRMHVYEPGRGAQVAELALPSRVMLLRPSSDGRRLVTIGAYPGPTTAPALWDLEDYRLVGPLGGHVGRVFSARFVAGDDVLTAGSDGTVRRWDSATGRLLQTFRGSSVFVADAALSPDGAMIVAGAADGLLRFWDAATGREIWTLPAHKSHVIGVHFEGDAIVTRGFDGDVSRWELPDPKAVIRACGGNDPRGIVPR